MAGIDKPPIRYGKDWTGLLTTTVRRSEGVPIPEMKLMNPFQLQFQQRLTQCQLNVICNLDHGRTLVMVSTVLFVATVLVHNDSSRTVAKVDLYISHTKLRKTDH